MNLRTGSTGARRSLTGPCGALTSSWLGPEQVDRWLVSLFDAAARRPAATSRSSPSVATAGPSSRRTATSTCCSCTTAQSDVNELAEALWYPIWDEGMKLGHAVRTIDEALGARRRRPRHGHVPASTRHLAGATSLTEELRTPPSTRGASGRSAVAGAGRSVVGRHRRAGEVAFLLEPDLKEGRGGLRDVHALRWAEAARPC